MSGLFFTAEVLDRISQLEQDVKEIKTAISNNKRDNPIPKHWMSTTRFCEKYCFLHKNTINNMLSKHKEYFANHSAKYNRENFVDPAAVVMFVKKGDSSTLINLLNKWRKHLPELEMLYQSVD